MLHPRAEHVWVTGVEVWGDRRSPGLLLGWRRARDGTWEGWVVTASVGTPARQDGPYVRQTWVPAAAIVRAAPPLRPPGTVRDGHPRHPGGPGGAGK
ncbi:hypothetical protein [Nocardioides sp. 1609]|uniref:hypothetical protein n=1 Tax=Nocardioides sp. 1609 TaxID=2508327 RepID=UPI00106FFD58|nr:hypothetical protein [Nocardioides sp. 1609]